MPSKSYISPEASVTWADSGGDKLLDLGGLAAGSVKCGAYADLGSGARSDIYELELFIDGFGSAPTVGQTVDLFITQSNDGTNFDGEPSAAPGSSSEGTVTANQALNMLYVGSVVVASTTAADGLRARFSARLTGRYVAPVVINRTAVALLGTADAHRVILTPTPQESQ